MDETAELWKVLAGVSATAAGAVVASHFKLRERVTRVEERVTALTEKVDDTLSAVMRLEETSRTQALLTDRMAIQVDSIFDTLKSRPWPGRSETP